MSTQKPLRQVWHHQVLGGVGMSIGCVLFFWMGDLIGGTIGTIYKISATASGIYVAYALVTTVYFMDVNRSTWIGVKAPIDRILSDLGTVMAEEGGGPVHERPPEETPFYKMRWTHVYDLDGGLTMHIRNKGDWKTVFIGPVGKDDQEKVRSLMDLVKRAGSKV